MSQSHFSAEQALPEHLPHRIINLLPYTLSLYSQEQELLCQIAPSFSPVKVTNFWQFIAPPDHPRRKYQEIGNILVPRSQGGDPVRIPVITLATIIPRDLGVSGTLEGLPARIAPSVVYQPQWFISTEEVARLAAKQGRYDVLTFDPTMLLFDEESGKGIQRFVQW